jgi:hypothetical protein
VSESSRAITLNINYSRSASQETSHNTQEVSIYYIASDPANAVKLFEIASSAMPSVLAISPRYINLPDIPSNNETEKHGKGNDRTHRGISEKSFLPAQI